MIDFAFSDKILLFCKVKLINKLRVSGLCVDSLYFKNLHFKSFPFISLLTVNMYLIR